MIAVAWIFFAIFGGGAIAFAIAFVQLYQERREAEALPTCIATFSLILCLLTLFLVPVDIYTVSSHGGQAAQDAVGITSYVLYGFVIAAVFIFIPFTYFFYEEADEDTTLSGRAIGGCKYTSCCVIIVVILLVIGLVLQAPDVEESEDKNADRVINNLLDTQNGGEAAIGFAIGVLMIIGFVCLTTYTAFGMSALPVSMIRSKTLLSDESEGLTEDRQVNQEKMRAVSSKYITGRAMSKKDKKDLERMKRTEALLSRKDKKIAEERDSWRTKLRPIFRPCSILGGVLSFLFSLVLITSFVLTGLDRGLHSTTGFVLVDPQYPNIIDIALTALSEAFPFDFIALALITLFFFASTIAGISKLGVRFLWLHLYKVRIGRTVPQGVLCTCIILMLTLLAVNLQMQTIAPQYVMYGNQEFVNEEGEKEPCHMGVPLNTTDCVLTRTASFLTRVNTRTPAFGLIYFIFNWLFVAVYLLGLLYTGCKAAGSNVSIGSESSSD